MATTQNSERKLDEIGRNAFGSIRDMVNAKNCDWDRLEELRDERDAWYEEDGTTWAHANCLDAEELSELEAEAGEATDQEDAEQRISGDPLSLRIFGERIDGEWAADRFELLLTTGGPAVRIMGELDEYGEPDRAWMEVQDWFTPWTLYTEPGIGDVLLDYCRTFTFID